MNLSMVSDLLENTSELLLNFSEVNKTSLAHRCKEVADF